MQVSKLSTTVDWAVDKCHFGRMPGIKKECLGLAAATFVMSSKALPVDNFSGFRARGEAA